MTEWEALEHWRDLAGSKGTVWWFGNLGQRQNEIWHDYASGEYVIRDADLEQTVAGPFETLEIAQVAYLILESVNG